MDEKKLTSLVLLEEESKRIKREDCLTGTLDSFSFTQNHGFGSLLVTLTQAGRKVFAYADYKLDPRQSNQRAEEESRRLFEQFSGEVTLKGTYQGRMFIMTSFCSGEYEVRF